MFQCSPASVGSIETLGTCLGQKNVRVSETSHFVSDCFVSETMYPKHCFSVAYHNQQQIPRFDYMEEIGTTNFSYNFRRLGKIYHCTITSVK